VAQFGEIARKTTAVVVPANLTDVAGMIAAAMRVFDTAAVKPGGPPAPPRVP
jgi:hypothetical protein